MIDAYSAIEFVSNPFSLIAFTLLVVVAALRVHGTRLHAVVIALAFLIVIGAFTVAALQTVTPSSENGGSASSVVQQSTGDGSPNVQGTKGDVTINIKK